MSATTDLPLPKGDYLVARAELRSGRVMLVYVPSDLTLDECREVQSELGHMALLVEAGVEQESPGGVVGREVN